MKKINFRTSYDWFLIFAVISFCYSFFYWGRSLDIHISDTYFIISETFFIWLIAFISLLYWGSYKLTNKLLASDFLTFIHTLITILFLLIITLAGQWYGKLFSPPENSSFSFDSFRERQRLHSLMALITILIFAAGQILYGVNLITGILKQKK